ncbi:MAG: type II secretion system protein [Candidatus Taylorbacteria bacterium]
MKNDNPSERQPDPSDRIIRAERFILAGTLVRAEAKSKINGVKGGLTPYTLHLTPSRGFTLIEMIVSVTLFIVVMVIAATAILSITSANRKSQSTKVAVDNLSFALENMTRHIRVGTSYSCDGTPGNHTNATYAGVTGCSEFSFMYKNPALPGSDAYKISYKFDVNKKDIQVMDGKYNNIEWDSLTGSDLVIDTTLSKFYVEGAKPFALSTPPSDTLQPHVIILIKGTAGGTNPKERTDFNLQASVTQSTPDF